MADQVYLRYLSDLINSTTGKEFCCRYQGCRLLHVTGTAYHVFEIIIQNPQDKVLHDTFEYIRNLQQPPVLPMPNVWKAITCNEPGYSLPWGSCVWLLNIPARPPGINLVQNSCYIAKLTSSEVKPMQVNQMGYTHIVYLTGEIISAAQDPLQQLALMTATPQN